MAQLIKYGMLLVLLLLSLLLAVSIDYDIFDYFKFSIVWIPSFCSVITCKLIPLSARFYVHGLWPNNYKSSPRPMFPLYCYDVPYKIITDQDLLLNMNIYWANIKDGRLYNDQIWVYAWRKHGTCSLIWYGQNEYFTLAMLLYDKYDVLAHLFEKGIVPTNNHTYSVERIRQRIIELTTKEPDLYCNTNGQGQKQILEIRFCYTPGGDIEDCEPASLRHTCSDPQVLFPAKPVPPK